MFGSWEAYVGSSENVSWGCTCDHLAGPAALTSGAAAPRLSCSQPSRLSMCLLRRECNSSDGECSCRRSLPRPCNCSIMLAPTSMTIYVLDIRDGLQASF
jgi:hypothetical protein